MAMYERNGRNDRDRGGRDQPHQRPTNQPAGSQPRKDLRGEYFVLGEGLNRQVVTLETPKYLGPEATCRPGSLEGRAGFIIRAKRPFTPMMVEDMKRLSLQYESEVQYHGSRNGPEIPYEQSSTMHSHSTMGNDSPIPERFPPLSNPTYPGNVTNFTTGYPTTSGYATAGAVYPPSTPFTPEGIYPSAQPPYTAPGPYGNHAPVTEPFHHPGYRGDVPMRTQPPYSEGHHTGLPPPRQAQPEYYGAQPPAGYGGRGAPAPYDGSYYAPGPNDGQYNRPYERQPEYYDASRQGNRVPDYYEGPRPGRDTRADPRDYGNGSGSYR